MTRNSTRAIMLAAAAFGFAAGPVAFSAADDPSQLIKGFDVDHSGTLDKAEVTNAGRAKFELVNPDRDSTLDQKEAAKAQVDKKQLAAADPNKSGKLDLKEYMKVLDARFTAADVDKSGTVDTKELSSEAGKALLGMLGAA